MHLPTIPTALPKLGIYARLHLDANGPIPQNIVPKLIASNGDEIPLPGWEKNVIDGAFQTAKTEGLHLVGLIIRAVFINMPIREPGIFALKITIDGTDYVGANLRIVTDAFSASEQPSSQSKPGAQGSS